MNMTMQVAGVRKPLASVRKMCEAGNRVVFEDRSSHEGYAEHINTGVRIPILKDDGTYQVAIWIPGTQGGDLGNLSDGDDEDLSAEPGTVLREGFTRLP